jgi:acyl-CoA synthetase (AMP-forming)/AMP-acid ligase II
MTSTRNVAETYNLTSADVSLCVMPLFHVHGLVASTLATLFSGRTVVVPPKFNPLSFWNTVREHRATWYSAVPTIHQVLLTRARNSRPAGTEQLRFIRSCSAALSPQTMSELESVFGVPVLEAYGMTEAAHQMASNPRLAWILNASSRMLIMPSWISAFASIGSAGSGLEKTARLLCFLTDAKCLPTRFPQKN